MQERQLIDRVLAGDAAAERALYDGHVDRVFRLAHRMTGDETLAQDFTQETFIRAFDRLPSFRGDAALSTWLHSITMSVVLNGLRKVKRHRQRETDLDGARGVGADPKGDPVLRSALAHAIDQLSDDHRAVLLLHDVEGFKHAEIATIMAIPIGTSKARLARARAALRRDLVSFAPEWTS
ncbi:MAG: RNA polymerase sigma factor [Candidatus Latescibacterota bacterium]|nr:MAG: RNA polymerase sigma factor [Candidatus Latescibacterota bacterium]